MENVSKSLLIVGSVMLGIILLSTLLYMLRMGGSVNKAYDQTQLSYQTNAFNYQFEIYQKDDNNIMDMITLLNLAYSINSDNNYDLNNSVTIVLEVGNKVYQIPKVPRNNTSTPETFYNDNYNILSRNQVYALNENKIISVYDLVDKTIEDLEITTFGSHNKDKLSKIHIGQYVYFPDRKVTDPNVGKAEIGSNGTTYKYVFDCVDEGSDGIQYNNSTGRISYMKFVCKLNQYWELGSYGGSRCRMGLRKYY